ncbi:MAG: Lrp/AsnC family transcriptional regulator [Promethearchaeota archaeon]
MDAIDLKILEELKEDSRKSFNLIAKEVGKTEATVRRRVNKMIKDGIIKKFTIEYSINSKPKTRATVKIEPDFKEIKSILKELKEIEEITDIWRLSGDCGLFIKVEIESIEKFNPLIEEKISQIKGVKIRKDLSNQGSQDHGDMFHYRHYQINFFNDFS